MSAGVKNINIDQGATYTMDIEYRQSDGLTPINLTGYSGRGQLKVALTDSSPVASFVVTVAQTTPWLITASMAATITAAIPAPGKSYDVKTPYYYDIEIYSGDTVTRILNGIAYVSPEVTK